MFTALKDALIAQLKTEHEEERNRVVHEMRQELEDKHDREMTQLEDKLRAELNDTLSQLKVNANALKIPLKKTLKNIN